MNRVSGQIQDVSESHLPVVAGILAGFFGALAIMIVVGLALIVAGYDVFTAARLIAGVVYGMDVENGMAPVVVGTVIHLITGNLLGGVFALLMPRLYRNIWLVAGLLYGIAAWLVSYFFILPAVSTMVRMENSAYLLLFAHIIYGLILGLRRNRVWTLVAIAAPSGILMIVSPAGEA